MNRLAFCGPICLLLAGFFVPLSPAQTKGAEKKAKPTLEEAYRAFYKGMSSDKKEDRRKALERILFEEMDFEVLFPKDAAKIKKFIEPARKHYLDHCDEVAKEVTRHGAIKKIEFEDLRTSERAKRGYKRVLSMIPKDIPVYSYSIEYENGSGSGGDAFLFVNGRWIFIKDFDSFPEVIDKVK